MRRRMAPAVLAALLASAPLAAAPARYELDPVHTRVLFAISHAGYSQALGTVSGSTGILEFDPQDWSGARLDVSVPLQRLDLGDADWNRAALARNLLDGERWPQARFVSSRIEPLGQDRFIVHGRLSLHGITRELPLEVTFNALRRHPLPPFRRTAGFSATASLSRRDFGIDAWPSVIGDQVELRIEAEAVRTHDDFPDPGEADPEAAAIPDPASTPASQPDRQESTPP
ncbi:hypothetical protein CSC62_10020 [Pseudoxanthomonas jiangsuensis]|nr:YceI family protein [Pseudoxanthomonas jiangsuensis]KAF1695826.1 hypothetical protein CSC62_10020 [Pseudoxanthomonas jiangsuensis]